MPTLTLKLAPIPEPARLGALAGALTALSTRVLRKHSEVTAVIVETLDESRWFVGGRPLQHPAAQLEITITEGTNTADEKAAFVAAAFAELQEQLAPDGLEAASYVIVREVPAGDWGYGGHTQAARRLGVANARPLSSAPPSAATAASEKTPA